MTKGLYCCYRHGARCWLIAAVITLPLGWASADDKPAKSLDDQLLEDLGSEKVPTSPKPAVVPSAKPAPGNAGLDETLLDQLGAGADIELGPQSHPLARIGKQMRAVETLIGRQDTSARTQDVQKQILSGLEELLAQTRQQCQQCQNPSAGIPKPGSKSAAGQPASEGQPATQPPKDSTERLGQTAEAKTNPEAVASLVREVWGHLPDKVRERMQTVNVEEFLPKYEKLIEAYYQRLAQDGANPQ
jgi:hypothetical protein